MYFAIILFPLLGAISAGLFGRFLSKQGSQIITTTSVILSFILSVIAFYNVALSGNITYLTILSWIESDLIDASWGLMFDTLTVVMLIVVTSVSSLVHLYSIGYMSADPHIPRFMSYLSLFTFFMLILVTGDNFLQMFVGWEGVGLSSYLLINFWHTRIQANQAAIKAMLVNRVGDFGLSLGIMTIYFVFKSLDFATVFSMAPTFYNTSFTFCNFNVDKLNTIGLLLFIGAIGKSAQLGLHTWLPDAMEGPTPVSALIHAATMVTAGVFMIIRCSPLFEYAPIALTVITIVGALTAFFAATTGLLQNDLKKVIAYSTCSQLGYMVFICGLSAYSISIFHLANHAFFKALLFLSAGCVIHAMHDEQDMRKMGGLINIIPLTYVMMLIGSLSLMGFPFLTGFYSKDVILEVAYAKYTIDATFAHWLGTISAFFTAFYSFRLIYLTFIARTNAYKIYLQSAHDAPFIMAFPLIVLSFGSIFVGYLLKDMFIGLGTDFWGASIFILPENVAFLDAEYLPYYIKLIPVVFSLFGAFLAFTLNLMFNRFLIFIKLTFIGNKIYKFLNQKWYFDKIYNEFIVDTLVKFGYNITFKLLDRGFIEIFGPYGIANSVLGLSRKVSNFQTGYVYHYAFVMIFGLMSFITILGILPNLSITLDLRLIPILVITLLFYSFFYSIINKKN